MNKRLLAFRLACVIFIIINFSQSFRLRNEAEIVIMFFNIMFTTALVIAEVKGIFDESK